MVTYSGINHLAMATRDMDMTIRYWRDLLGMRLVAGLGKAGYKHYFFEISRSDMIAFFEWPGVKSVPVKDHGVPVSGPAAFDHVAIEVEGPDDLVTLKKKLTAAGFWVSEIIDHGFIHSIYSFDPNNIPVEFSCRVPEVDVRRCPQMLDRNVSSVAREGADPQEGKWPTPEEDPELDLTVYPGEGRAFAHAEKK